MAADQKITQRSQEDKKYFGTFPSIKKKESDQPHRVQLHTAVKLRYGAIIVSWVSLVVALGQGITALVLAAKENSQALFGFGLNALLDSLTSMVVLWRFHSKAVYSETRERRACLVIAGLISIMAIFLCAKSIYSLAEHNLESKSIALLNCTIVNGILSLILATIKVCIGYKLESRSLIVDSIVTYVGMLMSFAALGAEEINMTYTDLWYIDSILGIICSLFLIGFAMKLIYDNKYQRQSEEETIIFKDSQ